VLLYHKKIRTWYVYKVLEGWRDTRTGQEGRGAVRERETGDKMVASLDERRARRLGVKIVE
jgi:hypothetical protein